MPALCAGGASDKIARSAFRIAPPGAGGSPRSSPDPGASARTALAEGGPRDAAWAAGSGATDSLALAAGGRGIS